MVAADWRIETLPAWDVFLQYKCNAMGGRFVMFDIKWFQFYQRNLTWWQNHVPKLVAINDPQSACVPVECCSNQANASGLHVVLWRFIKTNVYHFSPELSSRMPT